MTSSTMRQAALLLLGCGFCLGATFPLQKLAAQAGVPPASWVFAMTFGASLFLLVRAYLAGRKPGRSRADLTYYVVAALISFVIPNLIVFISIPKIGAGLTAVMFALSPIITLLISSVVYRRRPDAIGALGLALGLAGALIIIGFRGAGAPGQSTAFGWVALAMLIPVFLASGNVYRSVAWPPGADPLALAAATNLAAAGMLFAAVFANGEGGAGLALIGTVPLLMAAQIVATALMLAMHFRLQQVGGPVYLSQIGYVAAAVGLVAGTIVLGERYPPATWAGALIVVAGVALVTWSQARPAR
ncbi:DMT family transporter [Phreatobacter sp.]|uniref:DMT family transporter n=1 Tax=Phreatobacter sp. TaxID=1966341 RepID=UPI0025F800E2|nr:DMT family transporter [Phreatobacter sp.]